MSNGPGPPTPSDENSCIRQWQEIQKQLIQSNDS